MHYDLEIMGQTVYVNDKPMLLKSITWSQDTGQRAVGTLNNKFVSVPLDTIRMTGSNAPVTSYAKQIFWDTAVHEMDDRVSIALKREIFRKIISGYSFSGAVNDVYTQAMMTMGEASYDEIEDYEPFMSWYKDMLSKKTVTK